MTDEDKKKLEDKAKSDYNKSLTQDKDKAMNTNYNVGLKDTYLSKPPRERI